MSPRTKSKPGTRRDTRSQPDSNGARANGRPRTLEPPGRMSTSYVERIAVETDGSGDPVLMIHGLGGTSNVWTPVLPA